MGIITSLFDLFCVSSITSIGLTEQRLAETNLNNIEKPLYHEPTKWLNSLAYQQFTPEEYANGTAISILKNFALEFINLRCPVDRLSIKNTFLFFSSIFIQF